MDKVALFSIVFLAFSVTLIYGLPRMCVYVYFPCLLFLWSIAQLDVPVIPNLSTAGALAYGMLLALPAILSDPGKCPRLKFSFLDWWVTLMIIPLSVTAFLTQDAWAAVGVSATAIFLWWIPYILGRMVMRDSVARLHLLYMLCCCAIVIALAAAFESRLRPMFFSRGLSQLKLNTIDNVHAYYRWGLARALVTMEHHIDLGNVGVMIGALIAALAPTVGRHWRNRLVLSGIIAAGLIVFFSISFTCFMATGILVICALALSRKWVGPSMSLLIAIAVLAGGFLITAYLITSPLGPKPQGNESDVEASAWMRTAIVQDSWEVATEAGYFGYGKYLPVREIGVGSVDNSYMLFIMRNGWVQLVSWIVLILLVGYQGTQAMSRAVLPSERWPLILVLSTIFGILAAMYTVYFGFVYSVLFMVLLGTLGTMIELLSQRDRTMPTAHYATTPAARLRSA